MRKLVFIITLLLLGSLSYLIVGFLDFNAPRFINHGSLQNSDASLEGSLYIGRKATGIDFAIVILKELESTESVEERALKTFEQMELGKFTNGQALLILASEKEKLLKIEVSYSLEGVFTDVLCARIERAARSQMHSGQYRDFLTELLVTMGIYYRDYHSGQFDKDLLEFPIPGERGVLASGGAGIKTDQFDPDHEFVVPDDNENSDLALQYGPQKTPQQAVEVYLESLELGIGHANLGILTAGTKRFRTRLRRSRSYQKRVFQYYQAAMPYHIYEQDKLAVAAFKSGGPVFPIFLRRNYEDMWFVDEAQMQAHIHAFEDGKFYFKYRDTPFSFIQDSLPKGHTLRTYLYKYAPTQSSLVQSFNDIESVEKKFKAEIVRSPHDANVYFSFGDFYFFETFDLDLALKHYQAGLELEPNSDYRWRVFDVMINGSDIVSGIKQLEILTQGMDEGDYYRRWLDLLKAVYIKESDHYLMKITDYKDYLLKTNLKS